LRDGSSSKSNCRHTSVRSCKSIHLAPHTTPVRPWQRRLDLLGSYLCKTRAPSSIQKRSRSVSGGS
jgi:hypothetical protein